jgi:hypothetical protein
MTADGICRRCWHDGGVHALKCPELTLRPGWYERAAEADNAEQGE